MARSGIAAALMAEKLGAEVFVSDAGDSDRLKPQTERLTAAGIEFETGSHSERILASDYVIISPGIPLSVPIAQSLLKRSIPVFSELEFASWACRGSIVAVTGSNGKTTTTTLIGELFKAAGYDTFVCGNIGRPFAEVAPLVPENGIAVVEVSTYQLETIEDFKPHVALLLNLTPDHLDRHGSFEAYKEMKYRITENQADVDHFIINHDDPETMAADINTDAIRSGFSAVGKQDALTFVEDGWLWAVIGGRDIRVVAVSEMGIEGQHNLQNAAAAVAAGIPYGIAPEVMAGALKEFAGVEHRLEKVGRVAGINFVNDSKATNVESTVVALRAVASPVHLILGGRDKGSPYGPIGKAGRNHVRSVVAIGEARDKVFDALGKTFPTQFAESMEQAVNMCFQTARPGETVLLSPACASFDMFDSFEHRGQAFKEAVAALTRDRKENGTVHSH